MRITGGECRGRTISAPPGLDVRPTSSKIRQAFFNILSNIVPDARFVDVCAGSGLMGFEALSRGASGLIAIEQQRAQVQAIQDNIKKFGFSDRAEVIHADAAEALAVLAPEEADIVYIDPPYKSMLGEKLLILVDEFGLLATHGVAAVEHAAGDRLQEEIGGLHRYDQRKYGQTIVSFYRRR